MHVLLHSESLSENFIAVSRFKDEALLGQCFTYELSLHCQKQTLSFDGEGSFRTSWSHCRIYFYFGTLTDTAAVHTGDERKQSIRGAKNCCNKDTFFLHFSRRVLALLESVTMLDFSLRKATSYPTVYIWANFSNILTQHFCDNYFCLGSYRAWRGCIVISLCSYWSVDLSFSLTCQLDAFAIAEVMYTNRI